MRFARKRLTFANVAMMLALLFAMSGGAYAAKKGWIISSTKQIKPSVLKQLQGKVGPPGLQGSQGPAGVPGAAGKDGSAGANGTNGTNGSNGASVTEKQVPTSSTGKCGGLGGVEYTLSGKTTLICNGQTGFTEKLPAGKTETGEWVTNGPATADPELGGQAAVETAISFPIPLETAPTKVQVVPESGVLPPGCLGSVVEPGAEPGNLCIFTFKNTSAFFVGVSGATGALFKADTTGAILFAVMTAAGEEVFAKGTWAVTE